MSQGWISMHRKILEWEWYSDINTCRLFIHLLLCANHKDKKYQGEVVKKGSFITGRIKLAEQTGLSVQQIRSCLNKLKSTSNITINITNKYSIISITNWESYQDNNQQINQQVTSQQPTSNQPITTNNNVNNVNKGNNVIKSKGINKEQAAFILPENIDQKLWNEWMQVRLKKKAVNSETALNALIKKLTSCAENGTTENEAMTIAIENSWKTIQPDWIVNMKNNSSKSKPSQGNQKAVRMPSSDFMDTNAIDAEFTRIPA